MPQDVLINFDDLPVGTVVTNQYHDKGVDFFGPPNGGLLPVIAQVPSGEAHSGNQVANISTCLGCEFFTPFATGRFANTVEHISMYVGQFDGQPDTAQLTLSAFDAGHNLLAQSAPVTVTAGGGFNTLLSVEVGAGNIASFEVSARTNVDDNKQLGIDDLTFGSTQVAPPDISLVPAQTVLAVAQGASTSDTIAVARFNGSTGPIEFTVSGLPQGVTADFQPDPVMSDSTILTLSADINAPLTGSAFVPVTITATPLSPSAGSVARTAQVSVAVRADFTLEVDGSDQILLTACGTTTVTLRVIRDIAFQSVQIDLSVIGLPPGVQATLTPSSVGAPPDGGLVNVVTLSLTVADQQVPDSDITIQATIKGKIATLVLQLLLAFASFAPVEGDTPQSLRSGTEVTILGAGFTPDSVVVFGPDTVFSPTTDEQVPLGVATPSFIRPDGRELLVNVPYLATDGKLSVLTPQGNAYVSCDSFTVHSYRNTYGFQLENLKMTTVSFDDIVELYGHDQTHLTFTIFGITVDIANPFAQLYGTLVNTALKGHERCMGMALTAERFLHGDLSLGAFSSPPVTSIWQLQESPELTQYIHLQDIIQFSAEYMNAYLAQSISHSFPTTSSDIKSLVHQLLQTGDHPLVSLRQEITNFHGHVMNGYDLENGPLGPDDFFIRVYDPDFPFKENENTDGTLHQKNEEGSRVHVTPDGRWQFPDLLANGVPWEGGFESLLILPYSAAPVHPTIPTSLDGLSKIIFGDGSQTIQIADTQGRTLFQADGSLNTDPATRLPQATPFPVLDSTGPGSDIYLLGGDGPFLHTVGSSSTSGYSYTLLNPGFALRIEIATASLGIDDEITLDPLGSRLGFLTGEARKALQAHLLALAPDGDVRTAVVATTSFKGAHDGFAFDTLRQSLTYTHAGAATSYSFTLEATNQQGQRAQFVSPALQIQSNDTATLVPSDWRGLARATVTVTTTRSDGTSQVQTVSNQALVITEVAGYFTPLDGFQHAIAATREGKVHEVYFNPQSGIAQDILATFSNITSIAGYFTPIDGFQHVIVASADGDVHEVYFHPQKGVFQDVLAHFDGVIDIAGFFTPDDDFQHVLVATQDGSLHEIYFNPHKGIFQDMFANFIGIVAIDGFYTPDDNYRHAIVATNDGNVHEVYFHPQKGVFQDVLAHFDGIVDVAGFFTGDDNYRHAIVATSDGNLHEVYFHPQKGIFQDVLTHFDGIGRIGGYFTPNDGNRHVIVATNEGVLHEVYFHPQKGIFQDVLTTFATHE